MTRTNFSLDIPKEVARRAFYGVSMNPEKRGIRAIMEYNDTLKNDYTELIKYARTPELNEVFDKEFEQYHQGYKQRYLDWLNSESRCVSSFITGPSKFPTRTAEKRNNASNNKLNELIEYRDLAIKRIKKELRPELKPIMSSDNDAVERLQSKIEKAEKAQEIMKQANKIIRKKGADTLKELCGLGFSEDEAYKIMTPDCFGTIGFDLQSNNARINRMKQRVEQIKTMQTIPETVQESNGITVTDCPADNRVRLKFPGKPSYEIIGKLKRNGFRWAPSSGVWQAYRNFRSLEFVKEFLKGE